MGQILQGTLLFDLILFPLRETGKAVQLKCPYVAYVGLYVILHKSMKNNRQTTRFLTWNTSLKRALFNAYPSKIQVTLRAIDLSLNTSISFSHLAPLLWPMTAATGPLDWFSLTWSLTLAVIST